MKKRSYFFEIKDVLIQFLAAFNNVVIKRFNANREVGQTLQVRYVYAPKQRVIYDIVNFSQNITLPVVSIHMSSFARDENRVFNKNVGFYRPNSAKENINTHVTNFYRTPVPVNITLNMDIMTKYQTDLDQIISNFIPFCNPYIIISWKVPKEYNLPYIEEIRSEVLWNGNISVDYPKDLEGNQKYLIIGSTSFTIKGWVFASEEEPLKNIFYIDNAITTAKGNLLDSRYFDLSSQITTIEDDPSNYNTSVVSVTGDLTTVSFSGVP